MMTNFSTTTEEGQFLIGLNPRWAEAINFSFTPNITDGREAGKPWRDFSVLFTELARTQAPDDAVNYLPLIKKLFQSKILDFVTATNDLIDIDKKFSSEQLAELTSAITDYYFYNFAFEQKLHPFTTEDILQVQDLAKPKGIMMDWQIQIINPKHTTEVAAITATAITEEEKSIIAAYDKFNDYPAAKPMFLNIQLPLYPPPGSAQQGKGILPLFTARLQTIRAANKSAVTSLPLHAPTPTPATVTPASTSTRFSVSFATLTDNLRRLTPAFNGTVAIVTAPRKVRTSIFRASMFVTPTTSAPAAAKEPTAPNNSTPG